MSDEATRVYRPDSRFEIGLFSSVAALAREIISFRSHIAMMFSKDFRAAYRGTALGVFWNFILPLLPISTYILLANLRVFPAREGIPAALFISFGVTMWFLMTGLVQRPIQIVKSRTNEIMKTALPLSASVAASFAMLAFETAVRLALVIALTVFTKTWPQPTAPLMIAVLIAASIFSLGLGVILSLLNAVSPDVQRVVTIVLRYGIFLSGVIFPVSSMGLDILDVINPFCVFITAGRDLAFFGSLSHPIPLAVWTSASFVVALMAARLFYIMEYRIRGLD